MVQWADDFENDLDSHAGIGYTVEASARKPSGISRRVVSEETLVTNACDNPYNYLITFPIFLEQLFRRSTAITMPFKKRGATLTAAAAVLTIAALTGCNHGASDATTTTSGGSDIVATVNTTNIGQSEFYQQLQAYAPRQGQPGDTAGRAVLRSLIENALIEQLAQKENVAPSDADVEGVFVAEKNMLDFQTVDGFDKQIQQAGVTAEVVKQEQLKPALSRVKLLSKGTTVTDQDIQQYYDKNKARFEQKDRVHIRKIAVATQQDAQSIAAQIKAGKTFDSFLGQSIDPTPNGDVQQWIPLDDAPNPQMKPLITAVKTTPVGQVTAPISVGGSWWLVMVVDKKKAETLPLDKVKDLVRFMILNEKAQGNFTQSMDLQQKMRQYATTSTITTPLPQYQSLIDQIKNPPPAQAMPQMAPPGPAQGGPAPGTRPTPPAPGPAKH